MNLRPRDLATRLGEALLPAARSRPDRRAVLPLALFALGFPALSAVLVAAGAVEFAQPTAFVLLVLAPWIWWIQFAGRAGVRSWRGALALWSRLLMLALVIWVLADARSVRTDDRLAVVFVVDHSASITQSATDDALEFVLQSVAGKPEHDEAGLVFFGKDAAVELPPAMSLPFEAINVDVDRDGSDIGRALSLAAAMLPAGRPGRVVLVTDGVDTGGDLDGALSDLRAREIPVDVLGIDYDLDREVWLERLELPREVEVGETFDASVVLESLAPGTGRLSLLENGREVFADDVEFARGKNRYTVPLHLRASGYYEYEARIDVAPDADGWERNNRAITFLYLQGEGRILLVVDPDADPRTWQPLSDALVASDRLVDRIAARALPRAVPALLPYDVVVFVDVARDSFDSVQLQTVHDAVFRQGVGFLMVGGPNSFGPGGWHRTVVEDLLPVSMDIEQKKVLPKGALAIVLHTCEFPEGNTWGKRIAKEAMKVLSAEDEVGVLIYDAMAAHRWLFDLTPAAKYETLVKLVNNAQIGDMPDFATTLQMALTSLQASDASVKHVIVISDGDPQPPPPPLLRALADAKISVSTISIFPHGGSDVSIMQTIAELTGGRYYNPVDPQVLPSIFVKEAKTLRRSMIQERTFTPVVTAPSQVLKGIDAMPALHGYVLTSPKSRSLTILDGPEEEDLDPILSTWRYGLGATAAFTSDLSPSWGKDWIAWDGYRGFVHQLTSEIARSSEPSDLRVRSHAAGDEGVVVVDDHAVEERLLDVAAVVRGPDDVARPVALRQVAPRRYVGRFPLAGLGRYEVQVEGRGGRTEQRALGGFVVPYSREYLRFRADPLRLDRIVDASGGRRLTGTETGEQLFGDRDVRRSTRSLGDLLLLLLAAWIVADVALRRVQIDRALLFGWMRRAAPDATLGSLLERKRAVREQTTAAPPPAPRSTGARAEPPRPTPSGPARPAPDAGSTTARLLAAKRRRAGDAGGPGDPDGTP